MFDDQIAGSSAFGVRTSKTLPNGIKDSVLKQLRGENIAADVWNFLLENLPIAADEEDYNKEDAEDANE